MQTVPDLESLELPNNNYNIYNEQAVPDKCFYSTLPPASQSCETTPIRMEQATFAQKRKITPLALNFDDYSSDSSSNPDPAPSCQSAKKRKKNRRSYLSNDLPEEIRNQRRTVANARERARVGRMATGYDALQKALPKYLTTSKMRKVDILNSAVCHIKNLMRLLADGKNANIENDDRDMSNSQTYWDTSYQAVENDILQYETNIDFYAQIPNLSIDSCTFLEH